jgi:hypothetical protein
MELSSRRAIGTTTNCDPIVGKALSGFYHCTAWSLACPGVDTEDHLGIKGD